MMDNARALPTCPQTNESSQLTDLAKIHPHDRAMRHHEKRAVGNLRRAKGALPRAQYLAQRRENSLSTVQPWKRLGISRRTWFRRNARANSADVGTRCVHNPLLSLLTSDKVPTIDGAHCGGDMRPSDSPTEGLIDVEWEGLPGVTAQREQSAHVACAGHRAEGRQ